MLDALLDDGLIQQSTQNPAQYIPGSSLQRIKLVDILRSARTAEDDGQIDSFRSDAQVSKLLGELDQELESHFGDKSLIEVLQYFEDDAKHEDSLV